VSTREQWLEERKTGIGASEAAAVLGLSRWKTALHVQAEKLHGVNPTEETEIMELGLAMEPVILVRYRQKTGKEARLSEPWTITRSRQLDWMTASIDGWAEDPLHPLEMKHVLFPHLPEWGEENTDSIPTEYVIQAQHQMAVTDAEYVEFPVLMFGKLRIYCVKRNEGLIAGIIEREQEFWEKHIVRKEPVNPDFEHPRTLDLMKALHPEVDELAIIDLDAHAAALAERYRELSRVYNEAEKAKKAIQAQLLSIMGDAALGILPDGKRITRKMVHKKAHSVKESNYPLLAGDGLRNGKEKTDAE
jgi:putative phage-type endonuclease